jgi:peptidoglycan-associated lipoprotein
MKTKRLHYLVLGSVLLLAFPLFAQDKAIKAGDENFKSLQYIEAIKNYTKAWDKFKTETYKKKRVAVKLAECYRLTNNPAEAVRWYKKAADTKLAGKQPEIYYHYAEALRETGNCNRAITYYNKYLKKKPEDILGKNGLISCKQYGDTNKKARYKVTNATNLNSINDDYAACYASKKYNQLFLTSNRKGSTGKGQDNWTGASFSDIYFSNYKNNKWSIPITADETGVINTEANEGTPVLNKKYSTIYFTRCNKGEDKKVYCVILQSSRHGKRWSKPKVIMSERFSNSGQPAISDDELTLWFVSDRKGGRGGKDIWVAHRDRKTKPFTNPVNCGPVINTPADEMFPSVQGDSLLFFSSNGHPGYGGLDIFKSVKHDSLWGEPENLLYPFNSQSDDFAIIFKNENKGFFSSNRNGGTGGDDIYSFIKKEIYFDLDGTVKDERTLFTISGVNIKLLSENKIIKTTQTDDRGRFTLDSTNFKEDKNYSILFSKENYFSISEEICTFDYGEDHHFKIDIMLQSIPKEPVILPDILYDLGKWNLKPQYQDSLMVLVKILKDNPGLIIELGSHTDSRAGLAFNDELSQKRAQTVVDFLISQGINPQRLIAKGYGERVPRKLHKNIKVTGYTFKKGTVLNEAFINQLHSNNLKEAAHELNRRTEFRIVAKDFIPSESLTNTTPVVKVISDTLAGAVPFILSADNFRIIDCYLNGTLVKAILEDNKAASFISEKKVIELMNQGVLSKKNFGENAEDILKNNSVKDGAIVIINELIIGDKTLKDARFTVRQNAATPLTIGKGTLHTIGNYKTDNVNKRIIFE